ncbi:13750_t:CDS:2, partial [Cetraspora pellucida]
KKTGNRYAAKCKYCLIELESKPERLHNHVLKCNSWPVSEKASYFKKATEHTPPIRKRIKPTQDQESIETIAESAESAKSAISPTKQESILNWCSKPLPSTQFEKLHSKLLNAIIYGRILTKKFSNYLQNKLTKMSTFTNATICLDGWTDVSGNSIYGFMILKEQEEHVIDIVDLSANRHRATFIMNKTREILTGNGFQMSSAIACVTDNPPVMNSMKNLLKKEYPNIVSIKCCLHAFNLIAKNIASFTSIVSTCNANQKLVNFFTASHIWKHALQNWQKEQGVSHFLSTFCETRWYSIAKVCLGVSVFERGFQHCLRLSETDKINYPEIKENIKAIINDRYHFASNDALIKVIKPIVDAIGRLESRDTTLADIFKELIYLHLEISKLDIPISGLKAHALAVISQRAKEFSDDIYFIALFLFPPYKNMAISNYMNIDCLLCECLELAKAWNFDKRKTGLLYKELMSYKNNDPPFDHIKLSLQKSPREFWTRFTDNSPLLHRFAMKVLAIVPHSLTKTKSRNCLSPDTLSKLDEQKPVLMPEVSEENIENTDEDDEDVQYDDNDNEVNEQIEAVSIDDEEFSIMEEFFDFEAFKKDQENFLLIEEDHSYLTVQQSNNESEEWSIDDILENQ